MENAFNIVNLECPITESADKKPLQAINLSATENALPLLRPFQAVSLANNHIQDFLDRGCRDTLDVLEKNEILYFGLGRSIREAIAPVVSEFQGIKIAMLGATRYANSCEKNAYGTAPEKIPLLKKIIRELKEDGCFVIPYFHWGYEYVRIPAPRERHIAHKCIDYGADIVLGAHPHIYQGMETYRDKHIFYSLGNFIFSRSLFHEMSPVRDDPRLWESFVVSLKIAPDLSYTVSTHGYETSDKGVDMLTPEENEKQKSDLQSVSAILERSYFEYWKAYYKQAVDICRQNKKVRKQFQKIEKQNLIDKSRILFDFNSQDLRNRLAELVPWLFK